MSRCSDLFLILFCVINLSNEAFATSVLENDLVVTERFFEKLANDYGELITFDGFYSLVK